MHTHIFGFQRLLYVCLTDKSLKHCWLTAVKRIITQGLRLIRVWCAIFHQILLLRRITCSLLDFLKTSSVVLMWCIRDLTCRPKLFFSTFRHNPRITELTVIHGIWVNLKLQITHKYLFFPSLYNVELNAMLHCIQRFTNTCEHDVGKAWHKEEYIHKLLTYYECMYLF